MGSVDRDRLSNLDRAAIWVPQPGPQLEAFLSKADQLLFGGAAGGGKTSLGIGLALTAHRRTLFIRREGLQLGPVVDEIAAIVGSREGYNGADHVWRMAGGRQIQFGGVPNLGDELRFQGNPRDLLVLDEAANLLETRRHRFHRFTAVIRDPNHVPCSVLGYSDLYRRSPYALEIYRSVPSWPALGSVTATCHMERLLYLNAGYRLDEDQDHIAVPESLIAKIHSGYRTSSLEVQWPGARV